MDGILNVNKPYGVSSHAVVAEVRKLVPGAKVGHAGTLDPAATGVLPLCLGRATRIAEYLVAHTKGYRAGVELGVTTDTEDARGEVLERLPVPALDREEIDTVLLMLAGPQEQVPPAYSAVKHRGRPLYYWTRQGKTVPREKRQVNIYRLDLLEYNPAGKPHLRLEVECSRGTYIRTLAAEIGRRIGCGAHLWSLERFFVGPFTLEDSRAPAELHEAAARGELESFLMPMDHALAHLASITVNQAVITALKEGRPVPLELLGPAGATAGTGTEPLRVYDHRGSFQALARWQAVGQTLNLKTVKYLAKV